MAHSYHTLQHWNQWLQQQPLGERLLAAEAKCVSEMVANHYGKHCALIGVPAQKQILQANNLPIQTLISPLSDRKLPLIEVEGDVHELPIFSGVVDLVILPHTLEFVSNPRHVLIEACRIVKPEGLLVYIGFNPVSLWGIKRYFTRTRETPWSGRFMLVQQIRNWLGLAEFEVESQRSALYRYPASSHVWFDRMRFLEMVGGACFPAFGGITLLVARAKVIPLTPIRMKWKQKLSTIGVAPTMTGTIARHSESGQ